LGDAWMTSETVPRCESCGLRLESGATATLCKSCTYRRKKQEQRAAADTQAATTASAEAPAPAPPKGPDPDELRERLRRVEEGLRE